jgi:hypothetical protein
VNEPKSVPEAIERYLREGTYVPDHPAWPGSNFLDRACRGHDALLRALTDEVKRRAAGRRHPPIPHDLDVVAWTKRKLTPMVHGLFPEAEREVVLSLLERSVVFLTETNVEKVLLGQMWLHTAWSLANLYLSSVGSELLGPDAPSLLGLSEETTCYVSAEYFADDGRFNDFVIHEAAHVFHNWKRRNSGLRETRTKEWLLDIEFRKRETFAYSCEAYGWITENSRSRQDRQAMGQEYAQSVDRFGDEILAAAELADIVREACDARNGWKVILRRCANRTRKGTGREVLAFLAQPAR